MLAQRAGLGCGGGEAARLQPGTDFSYGDAGDVLVGLAIERLLTARLPTPTAR